MQNLEKSGYDVLYAKGDADFRIVQTAGAQSSTKRVFVVGSDTDALVRLTHFCNPSLYDIYFGDMFDAELKTRNVIADDMAHLTNNKIKQTHLLYIFLR